MNPSLKQRLLDPVAARRDSGLERALAIQEIDSSFIDLSSNDYLGLAKHPAVQEAASRAIEKWGCSSSASPLITGYKRVHQDLLEEACSWHGMKSGLLWNSGYVANQSVLEKLPQRGDLILADRLVHKSVVSGILRSGARLRRYRHCDLEHLESLLRKEGGRGGVVFLVTESVFSMDGDYPDLRAMAALRDLYGFFWIVDEAHALGWYGDEGSGLVAACGLQDSVDLLVGTMGKAVGSSGAYTLFGDDAIQPFLVNFADELIFSTFLPPACAAAGLAAIDLIRSQVGERERLQNLSVRFRERLAALGLEVAPGDSPIVPVRQVNAEEAMASARRLREEGILVGVARPPTVPDGSSRLRISLKANLSEDELDRVYSSFANL